MTDFSYTHINVLLDSSGSMEVIRESTIKGFNDFLEKQKQVGGKCSLSQIHFSSGIGIKNNLNNTVNWFSQANAYLAINTFDDIKNVKPLTQETFVPYGNTPLFDSIGRNINELGTGLSLIPDVARPGKIVFVIITDGQENASVTFTRAKIFEMISHQREKYSWDFVYLGANQDAFAEATSMGIARGATSGYTNEAFYTERMFDTLSTNMTNYRSALNQVTATQALNYTEAQRTLQNKPVTATFNNVPVDLSAVAAAVADITNAKTSTDPDDKKDAS